MIGGVRQHYRHGVARTNSRQLEISSGLVHMRIQFCIGDDPLAVLDSWMIRMGTRVLSEFVGYVHSQRLTP